MTPRHLIVLLLLAAIPSVGLAQCPTTTDPATYPTQQLTYPMTSDRYAVQYQLAGSGTWTSAQVYISYYGATMASPYISYSNYPPDTSMSFVSIPASASTAVVLRVTKIFGSNFPAIGQISVRPNAKGIQISSISPTVVQLATTTAANFAGDQFILYWNGDAQASGAIQGLGIFLDPPYTRPTGSNVKIVAAPTDLTGDLSQFDTLDFEGTVAIGGTGTQAFVVPANIRDVFLAPGAWVQGKLRFTQTGTGQMRRIYGPGVLDGSRFSYALRHCTVQSDPSALSGYPSLSWTTLANASNGSTPPADKFSLDGVVVSDCNFFAVDNLVNGVVNNVKINGWNGNNDGLGLSWTTRVSNVFVRSGDDSLKVFGDYVTVINATVWQNWNGGVVNLGWGNYSTANDSLIDGLYVVKMDWLHFSSYDALSWSSHNNANNAVIASLMTPGTNFGGLLPPVFRNIYVEDPPIQLFSLRIMPPACCNFPFNASLPSVLNLNLENVVTPQSLEENPIGFQNLPDGSTLAGSMNIGLTNVMVTMPDGTVTALTGENAGVVGKVAINGAQINVSYASPSDCAYASNPSGQAFVAAGGSGSLGIIAPQGCAWNVSNIPGWVTLTGSGNGTLRYQVAADPGADRSATMTIAGISFTIEQEASSIPGLNFIGSMPHIAAEENWTTTFTLVNKGPSSATARLSLFGDPSGLLPLPLTFPQQSSATGPELASSLDRTITSKASLVIATAGPQTPPVQVGSAQLAATGAVDGFAIFHLIPGAQEAVVPLEARNASSYLLAFDSTDGVVLGVAVENVSSQDGTIGVVIRDDAGVQIATDSLAVSANGHTSFVLSTRYPATANRRGTIQFNTPSGGQISVLGIRTTPLGNSNTLTTVPALANIGTGGGSIAHIAAANGWQTTFVLVNTGTSTAHAHLAFFDDNGNPLSLLLTFPQTAANSTASSVDQNLTAGATLLVQASGALTDPVVVGSAQLTTSGNVGGFVIFRYNPNGQEAVVPMENRNATGYILAYDNTAGTATGVAINGVSLQAINIPVIVRDDSGAQIATDTLNLAANGHLAFTLATDKYPATAYHRGTIEFDTPAGAQIGALGIRIPVAHTFTTLPALVK